MKKNLRSIRFRISKDVELKEYCDETLDPLLDQGLVEVRGRCCYLLLLLKR